MFKIKNSLILVITCVLALTVGCSNDSDDSDDSTIVIGGLIDLTGDLASMGQSMEQAIRLAEAEITAAGGIGGKSLEADVRDTQLDTDKAVSLANELVDSGVKVIVGELASGNSMAVATSVSKPRQILQCAAASSSPAISSLNDDGYVYRTAISDAYQGVVLASLIDEDSHSEAAVIYIDNAYGTGLAEVFRTSFEASGGVVTSFIPHPEGEIDTSVLAQIPETTDALLLVTYDSGSAYLQAARNGERDFTVYISESLASESVGQNLGGAVVDGVKGTIPMAPESGEADSYKADFNSKWGQDPHPLASMYYDCAISLALVLEAVGPDADGPAIRDELSSIINAPGEKIGYGEYAKAIELIANGQAIDYEGIHQVELDANGDNTRGRMGVVQFESDGTLTTLRTESIGD